jgi:hypothetical protein
MAGDETTRKDGEYSEEFVTDVQRKLDALDPEEVLSDEELEQEADAEEQEEEVSEEEVGEAEDSDEETEEAVAEETEEESAPTLPKSYVRSLTAYGWTDEEIQEALDSVGYDKFLPTAAKIHANRKAETDAYAAQGRKILAEQEQAEKPTADDGSAPAQLRRVDVEALKAKYGDDELVQGLIEDMAGPVNTSIEALNQMLPQVMQSIEVTQQNEQAQIAKHLEDFFGSDEMQPYNEFYGASMGDATDDQFFNRNKVLQLAGAMAAGAERQGRSLTMNEALDLAHDSVSSEFQATAIRKNIQKSVQQRSNQITLKPSSKSSPQKSGPAQNREEAEANARVRLAKVFPGM